MAQQKFTKKPVKKSDLPKNTSPKGKSGQLALDVFQTKNNLVIVAPIAGVTLEEIKVSITEDVLTIQGSREKPQKAPSEDYFTQECFWGPFSRSIVLPAAVDTDKINATFLKGVLTISIPKTHRQKTKIVRIKTT